jgi:hypothetical protein
VWKSSSGCIVDVVVKAGQSQAVAVQQSQLTAEAVVVAVAMNDI